MVSNLVIRKIVSVLLILGLIYLGIGLGFHIKWKSVLRACREARIAQGEFVEPEVFGNVFGLAFDIIYWPVYAWANLNLDGILFSTPCTH